VTDERRKHPRYVVDLAARLSVGADAVVGSVRDVCRDAALFEGDKWYPLQTQVGLGLTLPGAPEPLQVTGKVIRLAPGDQGTHAMAILFDDLPEAAAARIDAFIAGLESGPSS
jgi:hypothetical protein